MLFLLTGVLPAVLMTASTESVNDHAFPVGKGARLIEDDAFCRRLTVCDVQLNGQ